MPCSHTYFGYPRAIICQSEQLSADTNCVMPTYEWTPGLAATQNVPLVPETTQDVEVTCPGCGAPATASHCMPVIWPGCTAVAPGIYFDCVVTGTVIETGEIFEEQYECAGDAIDWTTVEFDYTFLPAGITLAYGGADRVIEATIDFDLIGPGAYFVPTRVYSIAGIPSNWALSYIQVGGLEAADAETGACCEP